jgi:hypothetical protein
MINNNDWQIAYEKFHKDMSHTTHRPLIKGKENMERFTAYALYGSSSRTLRLALELVLIQSLLISALPLKMLMLLPDELMLLVTHYVYIRDVISLYSVSCFPTIQPCT